MAFVKIGDAFSPFETPDDVGFNTPILNGIIHTLPGVRGPVRKIFSSINLKMAEEDRRVRSTPKVNDERLMLPRMNYGMTPTNIRRSMTRR